MSAGSTHVPFEQLVDFAEGRLSRENRMLVQSHVSTCTECNEEVAWLEHTITLMHEDGSEDAPSAAIARAVHMFRPRVAADSPGIVRRLIAALRFDSAQQSLVAGVRGLQAPARQLLYSAEDLDLDVRLTPAGNLWIVSGQILGPGAGGQVELDGTTQALQTSLNELGEFVLPPVPADSYMLLLRVGEVEVEVTRVDIGA